MRAIYFDVSIPRVLATQALSKIWSGAYFARTAPVRAGDVDGELPGSQWIRVENRVCGICASDLHLVYVDVDPKVHPAALPGYQRIFLGHEVVSTVKAGGDDVSGLSEGDRVLMRSRFLGPICESQGITPLCPHCEAGNYALCVNQSAKAGPAGVGGGWGDGYVCHESEVWKVPDDLDDEQGSLVEPLACGVRAALRRLPKKGEKALVLGCGIIGLGTLQAVRALAPDAEVYAAARYPQQIDAARSYGAEIVSGDLFEATAALTGASLYEGHFGNRTLIGGFDVVYDCVASARTLEQSLRMTRAGGTVVIVGVNLNRMKLDFSPVLLQEIDLRGGTFSF